MLQHAGMQHASAPHAHCCCARLMLSRTRLPCCPAGTRDHVHQLSVLNVASGQLLSLLLRACPGVMHPAAAEVGCSAPQSASLDALKSLVVMPAAAWTICCCMHAAYDLPAAPGPSDTTIVSSPDPIARPPPIQVCGLTNDDVHSPERPTFLQAAPLLSAFMSAGCRATTCWGGDRSGSGSGRCCSSDGSRSGSGSSSSSSCDVTSGGTSSASASTPSSASPGEAPILVAAHNARFDARLLAAEFGRRALPLPTHWR